MALPTGFTSLGNFELAFYRLIRGQNRDYKRFFRHLYPSYQITLRENLEDLISDLRSGVFKPSPALCVFQPKKSGILRPLRLLTLEDQIVYQAISNIIADTFRADQKTNAFVRSFGSIVADRASHFFYRSWKTCYRAFDKALVEAYRRGNEYLADFDLVSFYELIDHNLLRKTLAKRVKSSDLLDLLFECLARWTENNTGAWLRHGIPQGPEPSAFLADCFLQTFDDLRFKGVVYLRYVDDIKLLAKDEIPVRRALLRLDITSKDLGLVPQAQKIECRRVQNLAELRKNIPSSVRSVSTRGNVTSSTRKRLWKIFRSSITREKGVWIVTNETRFKFALFRLNPTRQVLRLVAKILPHRPDLSFLFASFLAKFPGDEEAADILLGALRRDPTYDSSAAHYIDAMDLCEPADHSSAYRRVIQTAQKRSEEKSIVLSIAATAFRGRRHGPKDALSLIEKEANPLARGILLHRLFGDSRAPFKEEDARTLLEKETRCCDRDLARYCASRLISVWPWGNKSWNPAKDANHSVKVLLKSVGLRTRGPNKIGVLDRFFKDQKRIGIDLSWRKALGNDWRDAERRCLRLQALLVGDPSAWVMILDTFNELLIQRFSRAHPVLKLPFAKATPKGRTHPDFGNWLTNPALPTVLQKATPWLQDVHQARITTDLAHAKTKKGHHTRPVSYAKRDQLQRLSQRAWAELIREWKKIL